jgi:hypothetical protein
MWRRPQGPRALCVRGGGLGPVLPCAGPLPAPSTPHPRPHAATGHREEPVRRVWLRRGGFPASSAELEGLCPRASLLWGGGHQPTAPTKTWPTWPRSASTPLHGPWHARPRCLVRSGTATNSLLASRGCGTVPEIRRRAEIRSPTGVRYVIGEKDKRDLAKWIVEEHEHDTAPRLAAFLKQALQMLDATA